ncbi:MAG: DegT/DnrJ/EryC1/StrS family aminotransferase [Patescibacteria group bacterium]
MNKKRLFSPAFNAAALKPQKYQHQILRKVARVIDSGQFFLGKETQALEKNLTLFLRGGDVTAVTSCHDALLLALNSLKVTPSDEVIFPANSLPTAFPVVLSGAKPIPVDVDENGQLDPKKLSQKLTPRTRVIILVHLYGLVGDMTKIKQILAHRKIYLIEDCAQAFGASLQGKPIGTLGDIGCFSFYPTKNLATLGDGGAIWTKHAPLVKYYRQARLYGESRRYWSEFVTGHSQIPEIQAGILNLYFRNIAREIAKRRELAEFYQQTIGKLGLSTFVRVLSSHSQSQPAPHLLVVEVSQRDKLRSYLQKKGVKTHVHYPYSLDELPAFKFLQLKPRDFPVTRRLTQNILSLPFHPFMTKNEIEKIVKLIGEFYFKKVKKRTTGAARGNLRL